MAKTPDDCTPALDESPDIHPSMLRGLAFMACPAEDFDALVDRLRTAAPGTPWDLVCFFAPPIVPAHVRVIRSQRSLFFAASLWWRTVVHRYEAVAIACADLSRPSALVPLIEFVSILVCGRKFILDRHGRTNPIGFLGVGTLLSFLATPALLLSARYATTFGLRLFRQTGQTQLKGSRVAILVPILPDLSHTFVYREVLELKRRRPEFEVYALEQGEPALVHKEAADLLQCAEFIPRLSMNRYLMAYLMAWLRSPRNMAGLIRLFMPHTASFGPGARPDDALCFLRLEYLHHSNYLTLGFMLAEVLRKRRISYIHVYGSTYPAVRTLVAHRLLGIPFSVSTFVDFDYVTPFHMPAVKFGAARFTVTCTEYCATRLMARFPALALRFRVLHHSLRQDYTAGKPPRERDGKTRLVYVGRFVPKKGLDTLIEACAILKRDALEFSCHLYGKGETEAQLRALVAASDLDQTVRFEGVLPNEHFYSVMNADDIFVCPCRYMEDGERDGIPVTLLECMAAGIRVVTTPVSGIPELVKDGQNGYLVPPDDPVSLARRLKSLILNGGSIDADMAAAARATVREHFSTECAGSILDAWISDEVVRSQRSIPGIQSPAEVT